jgi:hypothetical protein
VGIVEDRLNAQGEIAPGTEGWWRVFGARAQDVRPGDMVVTASCEFKVQERAPRGNGDLRDVAVPRFLGTDGQYYYLGALQAIAVLRYGTKHTLADSI